MASDAARDDALQRVASLRNQRSRLPVLRSLLVIRAVNALWLATFFQPDEYFQALEPAWRIAFGPDSGAWLTWEWQYQLRSSLHPALFAGPYVVVDRLAQWLPYGYLVRAPALLVTPKVVQAGIAAAGDWFTWQLAVRMYGADSNASWIALLATMFNPWQWYCSTRTFSNSLETVLTVAALYYWPWELHISPKEEKENPKPAPPLQRPGSVNSLRISLTLAAFAVLLRPTNIIIWFTILTAYLSRFVGGGRSTLDLRTLSILSQQILLCGASALAVSLVSDRLYFGFWTFPPYKWLYFNLSQSLAVFYGRNPWHYYLSQGVPLLCTTCLPFALIGVFKPSPRAPASTKDGLAALRLVVVNTVLALSTISHKEVRFIYPLLPILLVLAAPYIASYFTKIPSPTTQNPHPKPKLVRKTTLAGLLLVNAVLAGFLTFAHQPAPISVLSALRSGYERSHPEEYRDPAARNATDDGPFVLFLTPCHSTPWRSHLVYAGLRARALTCEPPLHTRPDSPQRLAYRDEADRFYDDPAGFLAGELWPPNATDAAADLPRYVVGFEGVGPWLDAFFGGAGAGLRVRKRRVWEGWNGLFNEDWRRRGKLVIWSLCVEVGECAQTEEAIGGVKA